MKKHKPRVETKTIRIHRAVAEDLDRLRDSPHCKLSYNDVIFLLLEDADAVKRKDICSSWIKYGHIRELAWLMQQLDKIWHELYNEYEYPISLRNSKRS